MFILLAIKFSDVTYHLHLKSSTQVPDISVISAYMDVKAERTLGKLYGARSGQELCIRS